GRAARVDRRSAALKRRSATRALTRFRPTTRTRSLASGSCRLARRGLHRRPSRRFVPRRQLVEFADRTRGLARVEEALLPRRRRFAHVEGLPRFWRSAYVLPRTFQLVPAIDQRSYDGLFGEMQVAECVRRALKA